jgi:hypothetical protein
MVRTLWIGGVHHVLLSPVLPVYRSRVTMRFGLISYSFISLQGCTAGGWLFVLVRVAVMGGFVPRV